MRRLNYFRALSAVTLWSLASVPMVFAQTSNLSIYDDTLLNGFEERG